MSVASTATEVVRGVLGDQGDHAADRVAPVERRARATDDLGGLQRVDVDRLLMDVEGPEVELLRGRNAIDLGQDAVAADAADVESVEIQSGGVSLHVDTGLVLDQVRHVLEQMVLDVLVGDDRDLSGRVA